LPETKDTQLFSSKVGDMFHQGAVEIARGEEDENFWNDVPNDFSDLEQK
jgi:hypothetical protein